VRAVTSPGSAGFVEKLAGNLLATTELLQEVASSFVGVGGYYPGFQARLLGNRELLFRNWQLLSKDS